MIVKAVERIENRIKLIDQTRLPSDVVYNEYDDHHAIIEAIRRLEVRGAPAIGITAAYALAIAAQNEQEATLERVKVLGEEIKAARPTAVNLFWAIDRVVKRAQTEQPGSAAAIVALLWDEAGKIHAEDRELCDKIGQNGSQLIKDGQTILTHCNTGALATGGIGTAIGVIYAAHQQGKKVRVYADETRPLMQGARLTVWELQQAGIDVTLNTDSMAAMLMASGEIDHVIVGADRIARNGDTANKIGTYSLAVLAAVHAVPFHVAAPHTTFDKDTPTGKEIKIEFRSEDEVTGVLGHPVAPNGTRAFSPAFDVTPVNLITSFITDKGVRAGGTD